MISYNTFNNILYVGMSSLGLCTIFYNLVISCMRLSIYIHIFLDYITSSKIPFTKFTGWYLRTLLSRNLTKNLKGFLKDLFLKPMYYQCPSEAEGHVKILSIPRVTESSKGAPEVISMHPEIECKRSRIFIYFLLTRRYLFSFNRSLLTSFS